MSGCCAAARAADAGAPALRAHDGRPSSGWLRVLLALFVAGNQMVVALAVNLSVTSELERFALHAALAVATLVVVGLVGPDFLDGAREALRLRALRLEALFLFGILGALGLSVAASVTGTGDVYYEVVSVLLAAYAFGHRVRRGAQRKLYDSLARWPALDGSCEVVVDAAGRTESRAVGRVRVGDCVRVAPGRRVPVDGIARGTALTKSAEMTGEPFVRRVTDGDEVLASAYVVDASLVVEASASGSERAIDRVAAAVEAARQRVGPTGGQAQRLLHVFLPAVVVACLGAGAGWTVFASPQVGLFTALSVLLVACPCALGFATPIATLTAVSRLAQRGLLLAGGDVVERLAEVDVVVFDKTGTLSSVRPRLRELVAVPGARWTETEVAELASLAEADSDHPVAAAFRVEGPAAGHALAHRWRAGRGIEADVQYRDARHTVGIELAADGGPEHVLDIRIDGEPAARAIVDETLVAHRASAFEALEALGITVEVVSGDDPARVARLGWARAWGGMTADAKATRVDALQAEGRRVLFVGDGVNDAAALARAHVGLALAEGAPLAVAAADGTWSGNDPRDIAAAVRRARRTVRHLRRSLQYAVTYNGIGITAAACGLFGPILAAVLMTASSLFVTARAAELLEPDPAEAG